MRIDHYAYQRGIRVAGVGFLVQLAIGLTLLIFGLVKSTPGIQDTAFLFGGMFVLLGLLPWTGLLVLFNQHKLERLETLEEDQLALSRGEAFGDEDDGMRVATRRLGLVYRWVLPVLSLIIATCLAFLAWRFLVHMGRVSRDEAAFAMTDHLGWAVAICLGFAALAFIFSRFVAGMAKLEAWQNLRGGAAYMVSIAIVNLAIAVGIGFRFFDNDAVIRFIPVAIAIFMIVIAVEIALNFVLNLYRPRIAGEHPRPAFDSKLLSLFAAPDNLVRSINEAVDYQFGFDITSSWGYQLLLRSFLWLFGAGAVVMILLNTLVIVEPHQQAVKLSRGGVVGEKVHGSGLMLKLPWPLQTAEVYNVTRVRRLHLTSRDVREYPGTAEGRAQPKPRTHLWTQSLGQRYDRELDPFIVGIDAEAVGTPEDLISLVDAEIVLRYRIRAEGGLLDWLRFSDRFISRSNRTPERIRALRSLALREVTRTMAGLEFDSVLTSSRSDLCRILVERVQSALDSAKTGVEVVAIDLPLLQPAGELAAKFDEVSIANEARREIVAQEEQLVAVALAQLAGSSQNAGLIYDMLVEYDALQDMLEAPEQLEERRARMLAAGVPGAPTEADIAAARNAAREAEPKIAPARLAIEDAIMEAGGAAASLIARAQRDRWVGLIEARTSTQRVASELASYLAAPRLYRERARMRVLTDAMSGQQNRYLFAVDPGRIDLRLDLTEINSQFNIADGIQQEEDFMESGGQ